MHDLVDGYEDLLFVIGDDGGGGEGHQRVFHASEGERRGQHQNSVVPPGVLTEHFFRLVQISVQVLETFGRLVQEARLSDDSSSLANLPVGQVSDCQGNEVGRDLVCLVEGVGRVPVLVSGISLDGAHLDLVLGRDRDGSTVGDLVRRTVLQRHQGSAVDAFTLGEQVGHHLSGSLGGFQPVDTLLSLVVEGAVLDSEHKSVFQVIIPVHHDLEFFAQSRVGHFHIVVEHLGVILSNYIHSLYDQTLVIQDDIGSLLEHSHVEIHVATKSLLTEIHLQIQVDVGGYHLVKVRIA